MKSKCSHRHRVTASSQELSGCELATCKSSMKQMLMLRSAASMAIVQLTPKLTGFLRIQSLSSSVAPRRYRLSPLSKKALVNTGRDCRRESSQGTLTSEPSCRTTESAALRAGGQS